ncbi:MAG: hypothetical protein SGARI_002834 [Bacillariaceae sp.]
MLSLPDLVSAQLALPPTRSTQAKRTEALWPQQPLAPEAFPQVLWHPVSLQLPARLRPPLSEARVFRASAQVSLVGTTSPRHSVFTSHPKMLVSLEILGQAIPSGMRGLQEYPAAPHQKEHSLATSTELTKGDAEMKGATASLKRSSEKTDDTSEKTPKKLRSSDPVVSFVTKLKKAGKKTGKEDLFALFVAKYPPENNQFYSLRELTEHVKRRVDSPLYKMKVESLWNSLKDSGKVHPKLCQSHLKACFARFNKTLELPLPGARFAKEQQEMAQGDKVEQLLATYPQLPPGFFDSNLALLFLHYQDSASSIFGMPAWDLAEALAKKKLITITPAVFYATFHRMVEFDNSLRVLIQQWFPKGLCEPLFNELSLYLKAANPRNKIDIYCLFCKHGFGWVPQLHLSRFCDALHVLCVKTENGKVA